MNRAAVVASAERAAWDAYTACVQALALPTGEQFDLFRHEFAALVEWRGIWRACVEEQTRVESCQ